MVAFQQEFASGIEALDWVRAGSTGASMPVKIHGETFVLCADKAVYWPRQRMLIIADLHFGKEMVLRSRGQAVPLFTQRDDLARLSRLIITFDAKSLLVLGDFFHHVSGVTDEAATMLAAWRKQHPIPILLTEGNHDQGLLGIASSWGLTLVGDLWEQAGFHFTHSAITHEAKFTWSGHYHPCIRLRNSFDRIRLPAFYLDSQQAILPAFGGVTGTHPLPAKARGLIVATGEGQLFPFLNGRLIQPTDPVKSIFRAES